MPKTKPPASVSVTDTGERDVWRCGAARASIRPVRRGFETHLGYQGVSVRARTYRDREQAEKVADEWCRREAQGELNAAEGLPRWPELEDAAL